MCKFKRTVLIGLVVVVFGGNACDLPSPTQGSPAAQMGELQTAELNSAERVLNPRRKRVQRDARLKAIACVDNAFLTTNLMAMSALLYPIEDGTVQHYKGTHS